MHFCKYMGITCVHGSCDHLWQCHARFAFASTWIMWSLMSTHTRIMCIVHESCDHLCLCAFASTQIMWSFMSQVRTDHVITCTCHTIWGPRSCWCFWNFTAIRIYYFLNSTHFFPQSSKYLVVLWAYLFLFFFPNAVQLECTSCWSDLFYSGNDIWSSQLPSWSNFR